MSFASKVIRKAAAITTGAVMMGATISGALAVTLKDYPAEFKDALVVVGTAASGADDVAAADIAADIPTSMKTTSISGDQYPIETTGDQLNIGQTLYSIDPEISYKDLDLLAKQTWVDSQGDNTGDYDFKQTIVFHNSTTGTSTGFWNFENDPDRDGKPADDYIFFDNSLTRFTWNYTMDIVGSEIKIKDATDIENTVWTILGRDYTIVDAGISNTSYGLLDKVTLLAGDVTATLVQGSTQAGVTIVDVDEAETKCVIEYQGKSYVIDKGEIKTMADGTMIGVSDVTAIHESGAGQDMCEVSIGAHKIVLQQNKEVEVNNEKVTGTLVALNDGTTGFTQLSILYAPEDKIRLKNGESIEDPVFNAFKIVFDSIVEDTEEIIIDPSGDNVDLTVTNKNDEKLDQFTICWLNGSKGSSATRSFLWGEDIDRPFVAWEASATVSNNITNTSMGVEGLKQMKGIRFLGSWNKESNIYEIASIDTSANETDIKVIESGDLFSDISYTEGTVTAISDINANLKLSFDQNTGATSQWVNFTDLYDSYGPYYWTSNGANISFGNETGNWANNMNATASFTQIYNNGSMTLGNCSITIGEVDDSKEASVILSSIKNQFAWDSTDDEIEFATYGVNGAASGTPGSGYLYEKDRSDSYTKEGRTYYGTKMHYETKNDGIANIYYPDEASYAKVVIAASEAVTGTISSAKYVSESEVTSQASQDLVLVGGPCANGLTASFMGADKAMPTCATGFKAGEGLLKLFDNGANVALVVAGYNAEDTKMAAAALGKTLPSAKSAIVSGTGLELSEITVTAE